jgi:hypothetical protein
MILLFECCLCHADGSRLFLLNDYCVRCHLTCERNGKPNSVLLWKKSVHFPQHAGCADCHGGDRYLNIKFKKGHIGFLDKHETKQMCRRCHRHEYELSEKRSLMKILTGDKCSVSCIDCHGHHKIEPSSGNRINIVNCSSCHSANAAKDLIHTIMLADSKLKALEERIKKRIGQIYPTVNYIADLENLKNEFKDNIHQKSMAELPEAIRSGTLTSAEELQAVMETTSPTYWYVQGIAVISFLALCFAMTLYLGKVLLKIPDSMAYGLIRSGFKPPSPKTGGTNTAKAQLDKKAGCRATPGK